VSLIAVLGQLNGRMVILYRQFKRKKETNKQTKTKFLVEIFHYYKTYRKSSVGLDMFCAGGIGIVGVATR